MVTNSLSALLLNFALLNPIAGLVATDVAPEVLVEEETVEQIVEEEAHTSSQTTVLTLRQYILATLCEEQEFEVDTCWKTLEAMIIKESNGYRYAVGDQGRSHGYYQIQTKLHNVSLWCARDLECSTRWTLNHLERNGFSEDQYYAVKRHNGWGPMADKYATHVLSMAANF